MFISSVRRGLETERDYLPGLLKAIGHEPRFFEGFPAQRRPSREAVLGAVEEADVYLLLLGSLYGEPTEDTGLAATEEEFIVAKRRGMPIFVFRKRGVEPEDLQRDFIKRVGEYQGGRFWKEFSDNGELATAVIEALREISAAAAPLRWEPVDPVPVNWRSERPAFADRSNIEPPQLEVHLLSNSSRPAMSVSALQGLQRRLIRAARETELFPETAAVRTGSDASSVWATSIIEDDRGFYQPERIQHGGTRGVAAERTGSVLVFRTLPRDFLGSLVDRESLSADLDPMLRLAAELVPGEVGLVLPAAGLEPIERVREGDPRHLGRNSGSGPRMGRTAPVRTEADAAVPLSAFPMGASEVAQELAARLIAELRTRGN